MVCDVLSMFITVTIFCNNVLCNHMIVTGYVLIGEIACNKCPVLLLLLYCFQVITAALAVTSQFDVSLGSIRMRPPRHSVRTVHQGSSATTPSPLSPCTTAVTALKVGPTGNHYFICSVLYWNGQLV